MFYLKHLNQENVRFYIVPSKESHTVGRTAADLLLQEDTTISRLHGKLVLKRGKLFLIDAGSKYGIFINDNIETAKKIEKDKEIPLKPGDRIRFGMKQNEFIVEQYVACTATSTLSTEQKEGLQRTLKDIGGTVEENLTKKCTHLTMSTVQVTAKQLIALAFGLPIVSLKYWTDVAKAVSEQKQIPDANKYLPEIGEKFFSKDTHLFAINLARKELFKGKIFYFFTKKQFDLYKQTVEAAGGKCNALYNHNSKIKKNQLTGQNAVVIQYAANQNSQASESIDGLASYIRSKDLRLIPEAEIQLAILHCSIQKYCNPKFKFEENVAPLRVQKSDTLAPNTEGLSACSNQAFISRHDIIPETEPSASNSMQIDTLPNKTPILIDDDDSQTNDKTGSGEKRKRTSDPEVMASKKLAVGKSKPSTSKGYEDPTNEGLEATKKIGAINAVQLQASDQNSLVSEWSVNHHTSVMEVPVSQTTSTSSVHSNDSKSSGRRLRDRETNANDPFGFSSGNSRKRQKITDSESSEKVADVSKNKRGREDDDPFGFDTKTVKKRATKPIIESNVVQEPVEVIEIQQPVNVQAKSSSSIHYVHTPLSNLSDGWMSKELTVKLEQISIKEEPNASGCQAEDQDYLKLFENAFEVSKKPMDLVSNVPHADDSVDGSISNSTNSDGKKNFKAFVKKQNYKPQTHIIKPKFTTVSLTQSQF